MNLNEQTQVAGNVPPFRLTLLRQLATEIANAPLPDLREVVFNDDNWAASVVEESWNGEAIYAPFGESLYRAFVSSQTRSGNGNEVLSMIGQFLALENFVNKGGSAPFNEARLPVNKLLRLVELEYGEDGKFYHVPPAITIRDVEQWETNPRRTTPIRQVGSGLDAINADGYKDLWPSGSVRAFISHRADYTPHALRLKEVLERRGIGAFVAYDGVQPARRWEPEILRALDSANITIALLSDDFRESDWTDHEIGISIGRRLPVISMLVGEHTANPHGFMGSRQALRVTDFDKWPRYGAGTDIADKVLHILLTEDEGISSELRSLAKESFVKATSQSGSFNSSDRLSKLLSDITSLTVAQENALVAAINDNRQIQGSGEFLEGAVDMLFRVNGNRYRITDRYTIEKLNEGNSIDGTGELPF